MEANSLDPPPGDNIHWLQPCVDSVEHGLSGSLAQQVC
jgi:hypothetical protein